MNTCIISAFPGCGKTWAFNTLGDKFSILDSDSSHFSWIKDDHGNNTTERNPEFPANYIEHIKKNIGKVDIIFVSTDTAVRTALEEAGLDFILIYPRPDLRDEWVEQRLRVRRNSEDFLYNIHSNWWKYFGEIVDHEDLKQQVLYLDLDQCIDENIINTCQLILNSREYNRTHQLKNNNATDGITWTKRDSGVTNHLYYITYNNGLYVVVGYGGIILTSTDSITWAKRYNNGPTELHPIIYGNELYLTVGGSGTILTSTDGTNWTKRTNSDTNHLYDIIYGNGLYVAVGVSGIILTSTNGITWTKRTNSDPNDLYGITYGNGLYVAVGYYGTILISTDGINWTKRTNSDTNHLQSITYNNGLYVVVGSNGTILTSNDTSMKGK